MCVCVCVCVLEKAMAPHSGTLAWRIPWQRSLVGCRPWGREESDTTERLPFHFSLSRIGEGNGNPLQCSCLENPRDREASWAVVYGVAQSRTRLKRLSSSIYIYIHIHANTYIFNMLIHTHIYRISNVRYYGPRKDALYMV